jgi:hypothetical protein
MCRERVNIDPDNFLFEFFSNPSCVDEVKKTDGSMKWKEKKIMCRMFGSKLSINSIEITPRFFNVCFS